MVSSIRSDDFLPKSSSSHSQVSPLLKKLTTTPKEESSSLVAREVDINLYKDSIKSIRSDSYGNSQEEERHEQTTQQVTKFTGNNK